MYIRGKTPQRPMVGRYTYIQHGLLEGVGELKTNETYHSKADALVIPETYFFENLSTPLFGNVGFVKFGTFSTLLPLPVMTREGYGQIVYETLPHILLSNASLVMKSCIARFVEGDAFNPSALSDCSTVPFCHWRTQSRPYHHPRPAPAVHGPAYFAAFARSANKRFIAVGKFERNVKGHLSMF